MLFFCQMTVKTKPKKITKNSMLLFASFSFLGEDFSHFDRLLFYRNLLHLEAHVYCLSPLGAKKKKSFNKNFQNFYSFPNELVGNLFVKFKKIVLKSFLHYKKPIPCYSRLFFFYSLYPIAQSLS